MAKTVACLIARTVSTRLPLKILRHIDNHQSMIGYMILRLKMVAEIDEIFICTSIEDKDNILEDIAEQYDVNIYRGSPEKVIERLISVAKLTSADNIIRITGDNVFTSYEYISNQINLLNKHQLDYIRLVNVPIGATAEVMSVKALNHCYQHIDPKVSEYLLLFMFNPSQYTCGVVYVTDEDWSNYTLTVDLDKDLNRTKKILSLYSNDRLHIKLNDIVSLIQEYKIENTIYLASGDVKMPYNKIISFEEFKKDMNIRIKNSSQFRL